MKQIGLTVVLVFGLAGSASAYVREKDPGTGAALFWPSMPLSYFVNNQCAGADVDKSACLEAVRQSFEVWAGPSCTVLEFLPMTQTDRTDVGYNQGDPGSNINIVVWHFDGWPYDPSALAITTNTYRPSDGAIVDTDMEVNGGGYKFRIVASPSDPYVDIQNTITHEAGHFVGLDHVSDASATMYPTAPDGETRKRDLAQDDIDGVCAIYPVEDYEGPGEGGGTGAGGTGIGGGGGAAAGDGQTEEGVFDEPNGCGCTTVGVGG